MISRCESSVRKETSALSTVADSIRPLASVRSVIDALKEPAQEAFGGQTLLSVDLGQVATSLDDNRAAIVSQNMLEQGNTREEAESEVGVLLSVLRAMGRAGLRMSTGPDALSLEISAGPK